MEEEPDTRSKKTMSSIALHVARDASNEGSQSDEAAMVRDELHFDLSMSRLGLPIRISEAFILVSSDVIHRRRRPHDDPLHRIRPARRRRRRLCSLSQAHIASMLRMRLGALERPTTHARRLTIPNVLGPRALWLTTARTRLDLPLPFLGNRSGTGIRSLGNKSQRRGRRH